ncbi:MAG: UvrD-helicase domain-containing protein, partial [Planctomycetota bacterium]
MFGQTLAMVQNTLNREQLHALRVEGFCSTLAIAGSGKTRLLASQVIFRLAEGETADLSDMAILTFTNKAGAELRHRIHGLLEKELRHAVETSNKEWEAKCRTALGALPEAQFGTIDAMVASWVRRLAAVGEIAVDPKFR